MLTQLRCVLILSIVFAMQTAGQALRIYHIDVDQADATLLVSPGGKTLLIDCGMDGSGPRVAAIMAHAGLRQVDHFVCTHYHEDHYGGIDELIGTVPVIASYDRGDKGYLPQSKLNERHFKNYQAAVGARAIHLMRGETIPLDHALSVTCVAKGGVALGEAPALPGDEENDMSIAMLVQYGPFRYFIGADIGKKIERKLAALDAVTDVDIYHADHHGSHKSSDSALMNDAKPSVIIISNGDDPIYQHPRKTTLHLFDTLASHPVTFQTNKYLHGGKGGNVAEDRIGDLEAIEDDGTILVTVDTARGKYTVALRGLSSEFDLKRAGFRGPDVVIESLLPDPVGSDAESEDVVLRNRGTSTISLAGWFLRDRSGRVWSLSQLPDLPAGQSATVRRNGMAMTLNNDGDQIMLIDLGNAIRDSFAYQGSQEGVRIVTGH